jgi:hypothetical protein
MEDDASANVSSSNINTSVDVNVNICANLAIGNAVSDDCLLKSNQEIGIGLVCQESQFQYTPFSQYPDLEDANPSTQLEYSKFKNAIPVFVPLSPFDMVGEEETLDQSVDDPNFVAIIQPFRVIAKMVWANERMDMLSSIASWNALYINFIHSDVSFIHTGLPFSEVTIQAPNNTRHQLESLLDKVLDHLSPIPLAPRLAEWCKMQLRYIVWTLAAHERRNTDYFGKLLNLGNIFEAMVHRFNSYMLLPSTSTGTVSAKRKFASRGSMSPLQKCMDIHLLQHPLVLCFAISSKTDSVSSSSGNTHGEYEVTDGWWWAKVHVDSEILEKLIAKV